jgi:diguanylate cyclase (GGDEF)-like protein
LLAQWDDPVANGQEQNVKRAPVSPDEVTQRDQVRRTLDVLIVVATIVAALLAAQSLANGNWKYGGMAIMVGGFALLLLVWPRRILAEGRVETAVAVMALAGISVIVGSSLLEPSGPLIVATLFIPIAAAVPYLAVKALRRLMIFAWLGAIATAAAASFLPSSTAATASSDAAIGQIWGSAVVFGLVLFLLYQSSVKLKDSSRDFRRLFSLSSDLAETTEPGILGDLVARHLAEATGMDDCVIYALASDTSRLTPFGSHPVDRSAVTEPESAMERPTLGRVIHDRLRVVVDVANLQSDPIERARLGTLGRRVMLLLPLVAHSDPVGVAELTSAQQRSIDERRIALAGTLAFEAAMAIENGRLYHELRERSLHDSLTGLANRSLFFDRVSHGIARLSRRPGAMVAVLFIDLDNFKAVNDNLGHARGDRLLTLVAERLRTVVRVMDTVARLGGDEFALLLEDLTSAEGALVVAERARSLMAKPFDLSGQSVNVSASIGVALRADPTASVDELVNEADEAMYEAKRAGRNRVVRARPVSLTGGPVA